MKIPLSPQNLRLLSNLLSQSAKSNKNSGFSLLGLLSRNKYSIFITLVYLALAFSYFYRKR